MCKKRSFFDVLSSATRYRARFVRESLASWAFAGMLAAVSAIAFAEPEDPNGSAFAGARFSQVAGAGGVPLNVVSKGDPARPAVLFVHGFRQSYLSWTAQFGSSLAERCHLVAFDLRGHGNSGQPWQPEAYDTGKPWADDVARIIEAMGLRQPLIVGWSFGGNVVMDFLHEYPQSPLSGVLLTGTVAGTQAAPAAPPGAAKPPSASPDLEVNMASLEKSLNLLFPNLRDPGLRAKFAAAAMRVSPWVDRAIIGRPRSDQIVSRSDITFVSGGKDPIVRPAFVDKLRDYFPKAQFITFPDAGHAPFLDDAQGFNKIIDKHCDRP